ncbi:hypothetical protein LCGC14_2523440 [marine sediment metagenome]|uniref:Uncharacterized protein n=1 Tax=marine sediment metagenome TaxID=412755 RepID=A0A0F9AW50_9ZZZZ
MQGGLPVEVVGGMLRLRPKFVSLPLLLVFIGAGVLVPTQPTQVHAGEVLVPAEWREAHPGPYTITVAVLVDEEWVARFGADAQEEAGSIIHGAEKEAGALEKEGMREADEYFERRKSQLDEHYRREKERAVLNKRLDQRKNMLQARQKWMDRAFSDAFEKLTGQPLEEYKGLVIKLIYLRDLDISKAGQFSSFSYLKIIVTDHFKLLNFKHHLFRLNTPMPHSYQPTTVPTVMRLFHMI